MADPPERTVQSSGSVLAVDDVALRDLSQKIGAEWETLATYLGITTSEVFQLKQDNVTAEDQIFQMMVSWRQAQKGHINLVDTLASALKKAGRVDLAKGFTESANSLSDIVLRVVSTKLGSEWEQLATYLQCSAAEIHRTKLNHMHSTVNQIFNLLVMWRQHQQPETNMKETFAAALRHSGRDDLAQKFMGCSADAWLLPYVFDVNVCRRQLRQFYEDEKGSISILPYDNEGNRDIEDIFVELELLQENRNTKEVVKTKLRSYDDLVTLPKKKVLVRGGPGSGKTTLVSKISYDWSSNIDKDTGKNVVETSAMSKFSLLLALNMRELKEGMSLVKAVKDQLLPADTVISAEGLDAFITDHQDEVLIILDGYDEYFGDLSAKRSKSQYGEIMDLLRAQKITNCHLIVTSRLHRVSEFAQLHNKYSHVELTGFAKENIKKYIWKYFEVNEGNDEADKENQENIEKLLTEIENSSALSIQAKTPVILALLCLLWQDSHELPKRITPLYKDAMEFLVRRWKEKHSPEDPDEENVEELSMKLRMSLGNIALDGLFKDKLIFLAEAFDKNVLEEACKAGLLSKEKARSKLKMVQQVSFVHKTFQEMCGGTFLADLVDTDPEAFDKYLQQIDDTNIYNLEYMLRFCCGLSEKAAKLIIPKAVSLSHDLMEKVGDDCRLAYDDTKQDPWRLSLLLLFESQSPEEQLLLKPLFERPKLRIRFHNAEVLVAVDYFLENLLLRDNKCSMMDEVVNTELVGIRAQDVPIASKLIKHMHAAKQVKLVFLSRSEYAEMEQLGGSISSLQKLSKLELEGRDCDTSGIVGKLASNPNSSNSIEEFSCHLSSFSIDALVIFISRQPSLVTLKLLDNGLRKHEIAKLLEGIKGAKLEVLEIFWNEIGNSSVHINPFLPTLRSLYLSNASMGPEDWENVFCDMSKAKHLEKIDLTWNNIQGAIVKLAETGTALSSLRFLILRKASLRLKKEQMVFVSQWLGTLVNLEDLDLCDNDIGAASDEFPDQLAKLKNLHRLNLSSTELKESAFKKVGSALKNMPKLQQLHLSENDIGDAMIEIAEGLKALPELTWLNLEDALLDSDGVVALSSAFEGMPKLTNLYLHGNSGIGVEGVEALFKNLHYVQKLECLEMRGLEVEYDRCNPMIKECFNELSWKHWESEKSTAKKYVVLDKLNADGMKKVVAVVERYNKAE